MEPRIGHTFEGIFSLSIIDAGRLCILGRLLYKRIHVENEHEQNELILRLLLLTSRDHRITSRIHLQTAIIFHKVYGSQISEDLGSNY